MMSSIPLTELNHAKLMAENNPVAFLAEYDSLYVKFPKQTDHELLVLYKIRALFLTQQFNESELLAHELLEKTMSAGDDVMIVRCNLSLSRIYSQCDQQQKEKQCLNIALEAAKRTRVNDLIAEVLCHLGFFFQKANLRQKSIEYFSKAESQLTADSDLSIRLMIIMETGSAYYKFLLFDKAMKYLTIALELAINSDDFDKQLIIINNLSTLHLMQQRFDAAKALLDRGLNICIEQNLTVRKLLIMFNMGVLNMRQDQYVQAMEHFEQCQAYSQQIEFYDPAYLSDLHSNMAGCLRYMNQEEEALIHLEQVALITESSDNPLNKMEIDTNRANLLISMGKYAEANKLLRDVVKYCRKHKQYELLLVAKGNLAQSAESQGDYPGAIRHYVELNSFHTEFLSYVMDQKTKEYDKQVNALISEYDQAQKRIFNLTQSYQNSLVKEFIGVSPAHRAVLDASLRAAQYPTASVLITGESGTGKDIVAQIIHINSLRRDFSFVPVNMAAISENLMESEFFGHKKGSFTGAINDTKGYFLQAHQGTLFLDEISEMPIGLQAKLLRVLESHKLSQVGSSLEQEFDTRIISSTNRDIHTMINRNEFRLDLFHRLNTIEIHIPPLRERPEDIEALLYYYIEKLAREIKLPIPRLDASFVEHLTKYSFPGNVRELRNIVERLLIMNTNPVWDKSLLPQLSAVKERIPSTSAPLRKFYDSEAEKAEIINALLTCSGKQKTAAAMLGISESTLTRRINHFALQVYTKKGN